MDDDKKILLRECLEKYDQPHEPVRPEGSFDIHEIMEAMGWSEDRARRKVREAVDAGDMVMFRVGIKKYYRPIGEDN